MPLNKETRLFIYFFVYWHSKLRDLFNAKAILFEEQQIHFLTNRRRDKWFHAFAPGISPKPNVIARLKFKLAYFVTAVKHLNHLITYMVSFFLFLMAYQPL